MEETVVVVVVVQEAKMGQSIDSGRVLGAAVETQKQQHCRPSYFFVSKLGVYSIHVRLTFGFPPFVVCVPSSAPQRNKEASNEKKQLKSAPLFYPLCVFLLGWAGAFAVLCCTAAVTGDE
jgi:hypothetical protein